MAGEIVDKVALAFGGSPPVNTAPPVEDVKPAEAPPPPPPAPPQDKVDPPVTTNAAPPPPAGIPNGGNEPADPMVQGRRALALAEDTGNTDELARFLRELRDQSVTVARGVAQALLGEASHHYQPEGRISAETYVKIKMTCAETMNYGLPLQTA